MEIYCKDCILSSGKRIVTSLHVCLYALKFPTLFFHVCLYIADTIPSFLSLWYRIPTRYNGLLKRSRKYGVSSLFVGGRGRVFTNYYARCKIQILN